MCRRIVKVIQFNSYIKTLLALHSSLLMFVAGVYLDNFSFIVFIKDMLIFSHTLTWWRAPTRLNSTLVISHYLHVLVNNSN